MAETDEPGGMTPPYEGRTRSAGESDTMRARQEGVEQQMAQTDAGRPGATASPAEEKPVSEEEVAQGAAGAGDQTPTDTKATTAHGVGTSTTRRGERMVDEEGMEEGRERAGTQGQSERPVGTSTGRDSGGVKPSDPITEGSPPLQTGDSSR